MKIILAEKGYDVDEIYSRLKAFGAPEHLFERMNKKAN
jgi:hypothetical protein